MAYPADSVSIPAQTIGESLVFFIGPACLVSSSSRSGDFHSVIDGKCSCLSFSYRGRCKHIRIANEAMEADRASAEPPMRTVTGNLIWCVDCGCEKAEIGIRCAHCHDVYWAGVVR